MRKLRMEPCGLRVELVPEARGIGSLKWHYWHGHRHRCRRRHRHRHWQKREGCILIKLLTKAMRSRNLGILVVVRLLRITIRLSLILHGRHIAIPQILCRITIPTRSTLSHLRTLSWVSPPLLFNPLIPQLLPLRKTARNHPLPQPIHKPPPLSPLFLRHLNQLLMPKLRLRRAFHHFVRNRTLTLLRLFLTRIGAYNPPFLPNNLRQPLLLSPLASSRRWHVDLFEDLSSLPDHGPLWVLLGVIIR